MLDKRYEVIKERLSLLTKTELKRIIENTDKLCTDTYNYDAEAKTYCPIALALNLHTLTNPTDEAIQKEIGKRFNPVNILKETKGTFYTIERRI